MRRFWPEDEVKEVAAAPHVTEAAKKAAMQRAAEKLLCEPQAQLLESVPRGTAFHRHYRCPLHNDERKTHLTDELISETGDGCHEGFLA